MAKPDYDITIIGAGPVGIYAGIYAKMRNLKVQVLEALDYAGGKLTSLYPEKKIYDVAGAPGITALELTKQLLTQAEQFNLEIKLNQKVLDLIPEDSGYKVVTASDSYRTSAVILAIGKGEIQPKRLDFDHPAIHYGVTDFERFRGQTVAIAGGGDSAVDFALMLEPIADAVHLIHRRTAFRAHESSVKQLEVSSVNLHLAYNIDRLTEHDGGLLIELKGQGQADQALATDHLIVNYGFATNNKVAKSWQARLEFAKAALPVDELYQTNLPMIYAIGDASHYDGKLDLISIGFGEGPIAVNQISQHLYPEQRASQHSSSLF